MGKTVQHAVTSKKKLGFNGKVYMVPFSTDASRFSSFEALLHVSVLCGRFLSRIRKAKSPTGPITVTDLHVAKTKWLRHVQQNGCGIVTTAFSQKQLHQLTSNEVSCTKERRSSDAENAINMSTCLSNLHI